MPEYLFVAASKYFFTIQLLAYWQLQTRELWEY